MDPSPEVLVQWRIGFGEQFANVGHDLCFFLGGMGEEGHFFFKVQTCVL